TVEGQEKVSQTKTVSVTPDDDGGEEEMEKEREQEMEQEMEQSMEGTDSNDTEEEEKSAVETVSGVSPDTTVDLTNNEFSRTNLSVDDGEVIRFVNQEGSHTVTLDTAGIDRTLSGSQSVMLQFNDSGTYQVYCRFHGSPGSGMHSDVHVE
ncbi:MAG: hypothetical protein SVW02_02400, partial [Candidatus Nanohaloarchaea archaeon]|nr:hypothetical protein [Candidatus Nanohaloarchaea archaeon]